jgi:hypothetical protein
MSFASSIFRQSLARGSTNLNLLSQNSRKEINCRLLSAPELVVFSLFRILGHHKSEKFASMEFLKVKKCLCCIPLDAGALMIG